LTIRTTKTAKSHQAQRVIGKILCVMASPVGNFRLIYYVYAVRDELNMRFITVGQQTICDCGKIL
jgi:hypothetical protein